MPNTDTEHPQAQAPNGHQAHAPDAFEPSPSSEREEVEPVGDDDPRPVFEGDWASASGAEKGEHSERVRQWKRRHPERATTPPNGSRSGSTKPNAPHEGDAARSLEALRAVRDDPKSPRSERIRASEILLREERASVSAGNDGVGVWVARRHALEALPPPERTALLREWLRADEGSAHAVPLEGVGAVGQGA